MLLLKTDTTVIVIITLMIELHGTIVAKNVIRRFNYHKSENVFHPKLSFMSFRHKLLFNSVADVKKNMKLYNILSS